MYFIYFNAGAPEMGYIPRIGSYYQVVHEAGKFYSSQSHISDINPIKKGFTWKLEYLLGCNWNLELKLQVTELKPDWLVEIAPHYYQMKDVEDHMLSFSLYVSVYLCVCVHVLLKGLNIIAVQAGWQWGQDLYANTSHKQICWKAIAFRMLFERPDLSSRVGLDQSSCFYLRI